MPFQHLQKVNQRYFDHFIFAVKWGFYLIWTGFLSVVHGFIPRFFPFAAPRNVMKVSEMIRRRRVPGEFPNEMISRERIGPTFKISDEDGRCLNRDEFLKLIDGCKAWIRPWAKPGMQVAVYADNSIMVYALGFALWEMGLCFFGDSLKVRVLERALHSVKVDALFTDDENFAQTAEKVQNLCRLELIPSLAEFLQKDFLVDGEVIGDPTDAILMGYTSGSTQEPRRIYHSHRSLLAPSMFMAEKYFPRASRALIYLNLNHLGYISCILLPAFWSGCEVHVIKGSSPKRIVSAIEKVRPEILPLFAYNWLNIVDLYPHVSLLGVKTVITGGDLVSREFAEQALSRGAGQILDVYGMTEALPPVSIKVITKDNVLSFHPGDLGELSPFVEAKIQNQEIYVKGKNVPHNLWVSSGDRGQFDGKNLVIQGRSKFFIETGEKEISCSDIRFFLKSLRIEGRRLSELVKGEDLLIFPFKGLIIGVLSLKDAADLDKISLEFLNQEIAQRFGAGVKLDDLIVSDQLPFNGIKINMNALMLNLEKKFSHQEASL